MNLTFAIVLIVMFFSTFFSIFNEMMTIFKNKLKKKNRKLEYKDSYYKWTFVLVSFTLMAIGFQTTNGAYVFILMLFLAFGVMASVFLINPPGLMWSVTITMFSSLMGYLFMPKILCDFNTNFFYYPLEAMVIGYFLMILYKVLKFFGSTKNEKSNTSRAASMAARNNNAEKKTKKYKYIPLICVTGIIGIIVAFLDKPSTETNFNVSIFIGPFVGLAIGYVILFIIKKRLSSKSYFYVEQMKGEPLLYEDVRDYFEQYNYGNAGTEKVVLGTVKNHFLETMKEVWVPVLIYLALISGFLFALNRFSIFERDDIFSYALNSSVGMNLETEIIEDDYTLVPSSTSNSSSYDNSSNNKSTQNYESVANPSYPKWVSVFTSDGSKVNVRNKPGVDGTVVVGQFYTGDRIKLLEDSNVYETYEGTYDKWVKATDEKITGWIFKGFTRENVSETIVWKRIFNSDGSKVNVRSSPGTKGTSIVGQFEFEDRVRVLDKSDLWETYDGKYDRWVKVTDGNLTGWIFNGFLR